MARIFPCIYRSIPGKRPWALYHTSLFFTTLGAYPVYWALTMCQIVHKISGWSQRIIAIVMVTRSRSPLASVPYRVLVKAVAFSLNIEASYTKFVTLLRRFSCLLRIESMHNQATIVGLYVATFSGTCFDASALWHAGVQKLPGRLPYMTVRI